MLPVELVHGSVTDAQDLDAIAVAVFDGVPLGGAGAKLDEVGGGYVSAARAGGRQLISVSHTEIDAGWIYLACLGQLSDSAPIADRIRNAAHQTADAARRHGLRRIGVVAYGGTMMNDVKTVTESMLAGLSDLAGFASITWFESNLQRFESLQELLGAVASVKTSEARRAGKRTGNGVPQCR